MAKLKATDLPKLTYSRKAEEKPGVLEHWLQRIQLDLGGTHHLIDNYWTMVMYAVQGTYQAYLMAGPLDRPSIRPLQPQEAFATEEMKAKFVYFGLELNVLNFHSCELRLRALLLLSMVTVRVAAASLALRGKALPVSGTGGVGACASVSRL